MQKIIEPILHISYLTYIFLLGSYLIRNALGKRLYKYFGIFAVTLGFTDLFYLIPRMYALLTTGLEENIVFIGWGRLFNSIFSTILLLIIFEIVNIRYSRKNNLQLNKTFLFFTIVRTVLCLMPPNDWFKLIPSPTFALVRFIPLALMTLLLMIIMYIHSKKHRDLHFKIILICVLISLLTVEPWMYFNTSDNFIKSLVLIRTLALNLIVLIGFREFRKITELSRY
jgi:phosphatidylserine synthase